MPGAKEYIDKLGATVNLADKMWTHYGWVTSQAYAAAYNRNQVVLNQVKVAQETHRKADEAALSFALSLLTIGVGGAVAGGVARWASKSFYDASKISEDFKKDTLKWLLVTQASGSLNKTLTEALYPPTGRDVFAPSDIAPEEYSASLFAGITYSIALLTWLLYEAQWDPLTNRVNYEGTNIVLRSGGELTADGARRLMEAITASPFIKAMPPLEVSLAALQRKAELALWIGWAYARDANYWSPVKTVNPYNNSTYDEQFEWEPLRQRLVSLGVPEHLITVKGTEYHWMNRTSIKSGLWMWGFMKWSTSTIAVDTLFDATLPRDPDGLEIARQKMTGRKLTENGWVSPKS